MDDIFTLLNVNKDVLKDFHMQAEGIVDHQTELEINRRMRKLKEIEAKMLNGSIINVSKQSIDEIVQKVITNAQKNNQDFSIWTIRELRIVSYYLMQFHSSIDIYKYALSLLEFNWRDMYLNGLTYYFLSSWNIITPQFRSLSGKFIAKQLLNYHGGNTKYLILKRHVALFGESGPKTLAHILTTSNQPLQNATQYFGNRVSSFSQSYYSDVIVLYFAENKTDDFSIIDNILSLHGSTRTNKLVFADLVERINMNGSEIKKTLLCKFANRILGDITLSTTWAPFVGATEQEIQKLRNAKQLVNLWLNQKIIETFFEVCVQDRVRKEYWMRYVDKVSTFTIIGSTLVRRRLEADSRINEIFAPHFIQTESRLAKTSALVLFIKNKVIVEFSDKGALYVYDHEHVIAARISDKRSVFAKIDEVKLPSMDPLVETDYWGRTICREEGRLVHVGFWQGRMDSWLKKILQTSENTYKSFIDEADNDIFKTKSIQGRAVNKGQLLTSELPAEVRVKANFETYQILDVKSKKFFDESFRVGMNKTGFYLFIEETYQFVKLADLEFDENHWGNIWLGKTGIKNRLAIVHVLGSYKRIVGYISLISDELQFKKSNDSREILTIEIP